MDNKEFDRLFDFWKKKRLQEIGETKPPRSKDCLYFTEIEEYVKGITDKFTSTQKQHIQSCSYCQKMIAAFEKASQEEKHSIPIYERFISAFTNVKLLPPRFHPVLFPALTIILIFIFITPLFNQSPELKNYSLEFAQSGITTRGLREPSQNKFKIRLITNSDCYAYLFATNEDKTNLLIQEKVTEEIETIFPIQKWFEKDGRLILILSKKPLTNISSASEIITKGSKKDEKEIQRKLRKELKRRDIACYNIKSH